MKISINGKRHDLGDRASCKVSFERAVELSGIDPDAVTSVTFLDKSGADGDVVPGIKCLATDGTKLTVTTKKD